MNIKNKNNLKKESNRKLTIDERIEIASKDPLFDPADFGIGQGVTIKSIHKVCDLYNVPRRLIVVI